MPNDELTGYPSIDKPWLKYYSEEAINAPLPECSIYQYLWENNKDHPNDIAINYYGREITYRGLFEAIHHAAKSFSALGVESGDIVTVALPNIPEALYAVYALNKLGAVANMIHPLAGEKEILNYLNEVRSTVAVIFDGTYEIIGHAIHETSIRHAIVVSVADSLPIGINLLYSLKQKAVRLPKNSSVLSWKQFIKAGLSAGKTLPDIRKNPSEMAIISHTGGTTGEPKGVMCSDQNINALIWQVGHVLPSERQDRMLVVLPPFVNYSLVNGMIEPLSLGHEIILLPAYNPAEFSKYIRKFHPNHMNTIPAYLDAILGIEELKTMDLSCLKYVYYGGESMSAEMEDAINKLLLSRGAQYPLGKGLGSTEMVSSATLTLPSQNIAGSAGIPFPRVRCMVCDPDTLQECRYNEEGEICFSGETVMLGYYHNQQATDDIIKAHSDGLKWLHTGDVGYINEDGVVFVTGRIKRIIMTRGKDQQVTKMFPDRIEKVLYSCPAIDLCCVIGVPDEKRIHYPKAYVVLKDGFQASEQLTQEIRSTCRDKLPEYMVPEEIEYRVDLPRTERGKIDYRALEEVTVVSVKNKSRNN